MKRSTGLFILLTVLSILSVEAQSIYSQLSDGYLSAPEAPRLAHTILKDASLPGKKDGSAIVEILNQQSRLRYQYRWFAPEAPHTILSTSSQISGLASGIYIVMVTDSWGQSTMEAISIVNTLRKDNFEEVIRTYPNPASEILNVELDQALREDIQLKMYDIKGNLLQVIEHAEAGSYQIDLQSYTPGIYQLIIELGTGVLPLRRSIRIY